MILEVKKKYRIRLINSSLPAPLLVKTGGSNCRLTCVGVCFKLIFLICKRRVDRLEHKIFTLRTLLMNVYFNEQFYHDYTSDPAAESGRMEAIVDVLTTHVNFVDCEAADEADLLAAHTDNHISYVREEGLYEIASLAAGGAISAALNSLKEPSFALIRPPGHHASEDSCWGFCYFNNMAVSLYHLKKRDLCRKAFILDFDLHYGDGNVNILEHEPWVEILNPDSANRQQYLEKVENALAATTADIIAVSAGFDNHINDWGGLLRSSDYQTMGRWVLEASRRNSGGCYGILEGGYNHNVLGENVLAFLNGLKGM